jgi:hypothetical protein
MIVNLTVIPGQLTEQLVPPLQTRLDIASLKPESTAMSSEAPASDISVHKPLNDNIKIHDPDIPSRENGNTTPPL